MRALRRDGRAIEVIGRYHPGKKSRVSPRSTRARAQYWLLGGAQPTEPVLKLKITGD